VAFYFSISEITFASYPASMIAAGSIMSAARFLLQQDWCDAFHLVSKLQNIVLADAVILHSLFWLCCSVFSRRLQDEAEK